PPPRSRSDVPDLGSEHPPRLRVLPGRAGARERMSRARGTGGGEGVRPLPAARGGRGRRRGRAPESGRLNTAGGVRRCGRSAVAAAGDACGKCRACLKTAALQHPDLKFLFPVSGEEKDLDTTIAETTAAWRDDPLFVFQYERAASIRLSVTRELLRELGFKPFEAARRVAVVRDADRMREDQYSAMLKSIEEPGASTVWILTTGRPARLPATIRSRCQRIRFRPLPEPLMIEFLEQRVKVS